MVRMHTLSVIYDRLRADVQLTHSFAGAWSMYSAGMHKQTLIGSCATDWSACGWRTLVRRNTGESHADRFRGIR